MDEKYLIFEACFGEKLRNKGRYRMQRSNESSRMYVLPVLTLHGNQSMVTHGLPIAAGRNNLLPFIPFPTMAIGGPCVSIGGKILKPLCKHSFKVDIAQ